MLEKYCVFTSFFKNGALKQALHISGKRINFPINGIGTIGFPHGKK